MLGKMFYNVMKDKARIRELCPLSLVFKLVLPQQGDYGNVVPWPISVSPWYPNCLNRLR